MNQRIWTPVEVIRLLNHIKNNKSLEDISRGEKRSISSIKAKLKDIAVDLYVNKNMRYSQVEEITGIQKEALIVKREKFAIPLSEISDNDLQDASGIQYSYGNSELNGSPKEIQVPQAIPVAYDLRLSTENPFSIESLSTLILSTVSIFLLSSNC